jgi:hypothetical protein
MTLPDPLSPGTSVDTHLLCDCHDRKGKSFNTEDTEEDENTEKKHRIRRMWTITHDGT